MSTSLVDPNSPFLSIKERRDAIWKALGNNQRKNLLAKVHNLKYKGKITNLHTMIDEIIDRD